MNLYNLEGKKVSELGNDGVWRRKLSFAHHLMKKYDAVGMAKAHWDILPEGTALRIKDTDTGNVYQATYQSALETKITDHNPPFELQVFIPLNAFTKL